MSPIVISYLPPERDGKFYTASFLENLKRHPTHYPLVTYSECQEWKPAIPLKLGPELPELVNAPAHPNGMKYGVNNLCFLMAFRFAWRLGYSHILYLEEDVRVKGADWDKVLIDEFCNVPRPVLFGGSMAIYNPCNTDRRAWLRYCEIISQYNTNNDRSTKKSRNYPIPTYGWKGDLPPVTFGSRSAAANTGSCVFVNGAGGIYSMAGLKMLFPEISTPDDFQTIVFVALNSAPWDMEIGKRLWARFGVDSYDLVAHLPSLFSSYGEVVTTEAERLEMLRSGSVRLVHQIKSSVIE